MIGVEATGITACPCAQGLVKEHAAVRLAEAGFGEGDIERILELVPIATHNQRGKGTLFVGTGYHIRGQDLVEAVAHHQHVLGVDLDVGLLPLKARQPGLMDQHPAVGQERALALGPRRQQHRRHRRRLPDAVGGDVGLDVLHGVVHRQPGGHRTARRVDVEVDVALRVLRLEEEHLRDHQARHVVVDRAAEEDDVVLEQARIDVVGALNAVRLLHHHRNQHLVLQAPSPPCGFSGRGGRARARDRGDDGDRGPGAGPPRPREP